MRIKMFLKTINTKSYTICLVISLSLYQIKLVQCLQLVEEKNASNDGGFDLENKNLASSASDSTSSPSPSVLNTTNSINSTPRPKLPPPPKVKLNKCCRIGEYLNNDQVCVAGTSERWVPLIYLTARRTFFQPLGESPKFITFEENVRPEIPHQTQANNNNENERCDSNDLEMFTGNANNLVLFTNGTLLIRDRGKFINPPSFCVDREAALICFSKSKRKTNPDLKLKKCCGKYGLYDLETKSCKITSEHNGKLVLPLNSSYYETHFGFPECPASKNAFAIAGNLHEADFHNVTGHVKLPHVNLTVLEYCLEHIAEDLNVTDPSLVKIIACSHHFKSKEDSSSGSNLHGDYKSRDQIQVAALHVGIVISVIFLAATLIAGYLMPSVHHVLHWRCQIHYVFCLFIGDLLLAYNSLSNSLELESISCLLIASAMQFFLLSAFFWLNVMCFNIWWTFRDFRPSSLERNQELIRLRLYSAYAWGIPLIITVIAATVNQLPETQLLRPGFGERNCWFSGERLSIFAYFFGPIGILLIANIALFISTTHQLTCGLWKRDDIKTTSEKTALGKVCLKLVVVMGVTWIADIVSWLIGSETQWFITDLINALQGVFIFIVVGCQPQVWAACKRFCWPRSRQDITNTTNGVQHSSSSHGLPSLAACGGEVTQNTSIANTTIGTTNNGNCVKTKIPMETIC